MIVWVASVKIMKKLDVSFSGLSRRDPSSIEFANSFEICLLKMDSFDVVPSNSSICDNAYLRRLRERSHLEILKQARLSDAFRSNGPFGLFGLFFSQTDMERVRNRTNQSRSLRREISQLEFEEYLG